jgi:hypothetical protein
MSIIIAEVTQARTYLLLPGGGRGMRELGGLGGREGLTDGCPHLSLTQPSTFFMGLSQKIVVPL